MYNYFSSTFVFPTLGHCGLQIAMIFLIIHLDCQNCTYSLQVTKLLKLWLSYWLCLQACGCIFASLNLERAQNCSSINPVNGMELSPLHI